MVFDNDPQKVGSMVGSLKVQDFSNMAEQIQAAHIKVAMIAVPAAHAQDVADELVKAGIKAILNYAPIHITVPEDVHVQHTDPVTHLQRMTYYLE